MSRFPRRGTAFLGTGHGCFMPLYGPQGAQGIQGVPGLQGATGLQGETGTVVLGNTALVDAVYGNDTNASVGGLSYRTLNAAVAAVTSGQTVWILPGTYNLTAGLVLPSGISIRGLSVQTVVIQMLNVTANTTLVTMGENCRVEDVTLKLTSTGHYILKGIVFGGTSTVTSKLRTSVLTVDNSSALVAGTSDVYGVEANGTGTLTAESFSFNCLKGSTINVRSNGDGNKRGFLVSNTNIVTTRDLNIYVAAPFDPASTGSYVGVETNDPSLLGSIQMRATTIGTKPPTGLEPYSASDILQTTPVNVPDPTYLASPGIQIGPGTDLVSKSAGGKGFSTYIYPHTIFYGLKGNVSTGTSGWLWPGSVAVSSSFPDSGTPPPYYRVQQPALISGLSGALNIAPSSGDTVTLSVQYQPVSDQNPNYGDVTFTGSISGKILTIVGAITGTVQIGQLLRGTGVSNRTYIVSGSGLSWTVSNSQTVGSTAMTSTCYRYGAKFTGTITSGTTLTVTSLTSGIIQIGQYISAASGDTTGNDGIPNSTYIVAGSGLSWTVNQSHNISEIPIISYSIIPTAFEITFTPTLINSSFYNSSVRLNTGDRILLYLNYSTGLTQAHDVTAEIDLF